MSEAKTPTLDPTLVIAIDGPVASGKTVVGRELARRLGWEMLDTGIMYRALTWLAEQRRIDLDDAEGLTAMARQVRIEVGPTPPGSLETASIHVDGEDATPHLREPAVEAAVSTVAAVPGVRQAMVEQQRRIAAAGKRVMVGRDIGTVVVPEATVKVFLTATPEVRARRRAQEMQANGRAVAEHDVLAQTRRRDRRDAGREASPLQQAAGSKRIDTTELSEAEVVEAVLALVRERTPHVLG